MAEKDNKIELQIKGGSEEEIEILSLLDQKKLSIIEKKFEICPEGLTLDQFVDVMLTHLDYSKDDEELTLQITLRLIDLFKEIDVNGDRHLEWYFFFPKKI